METVSDRGSTPLASTSKGHNYCDLFINPKFQFLAYKIKKPNVLLS
ncbi:MAG TPA: hypothetical protein PKK29_07580 [Acetivibrio saccincola]|nr:hypothetical protein [Acetivibrio saccincola]